MGFIGLRAFSKLKQYLKGIENGVRSILAGNAPFHREDFKDPKRQMLSTFLTVPTTTFRSQILI